MALDPAAALPRGTAVRYGPTGESARVVDHATLTRIPVVTEHTVWVYRGEEVPGPYIIELPNGTRRAATRDQLVVDPPPLGGEE